MKAYKLLATAVLALALGACATAEPTPQIVYVEVTATPAPTAVPTPTLRPTNPPTRATTDLGCDTDWMSVVEAGGTNWEIARQLLSELMANPSSALPGSTAEYLLWCVDEGWRGYFD